MPRAATTIASCLALMCGLAAPAFAAPCTRLPVSDVAFGQPAATDLARQRLDAYAQEIATQRGWPRPTALAKSNETVSCTVYLDLGPLGTEYRCLVTATFCQK